jgi:hypothetical protein
VKDTRVKARPVWKADCCDAVARIDAGLWPGFERTSFARTMQFAEVSIHSGTETAGIDSVSFESPDKKEMLGGNKKGTVPCQDQA